MKTKSLNIFLMLVLCLSGMMMTGCKNKQKAAQEDIAKVVSELKLPSKVKDNDNLTLTECSYTDNVLTFTYEYSSEKPVDVKTEAFENQILNKLRGGMLSRNLVEKVVAANASIKMIYKYNDGDSVEFTFPASELH